MSQSSSNEPELTGHSYDGIEEFDNPLPGWWKWLFVATILFCFPYVIFYHSGIESRTPQGRFAVAMAANARLQFAEIGELVGDRPTLVKYANERSWLNVGKSVYQTHCVSCHRADGGGLVGPNLTDEHYKNVKQIEDIYTVIFKGAGGGAMPAWNNRLAQNEMVLVAAYVASIRGTEPGGTPRPAEGNVIPPWPTIDEIASELEAEAETEAETEAEAETETETEAEAEAESEVSANAVESTQ